MPGGVGGRPVVEAMDKLLGTALPVLDDGFVRVVDYMGDDRAIVQAARVSYGQGTKHVSDDRALIRYLMRHRHTTPFEMCELKLHVRVPMDVWRQWIRHRTASVNEYSTRYSVSIDSAHRTKPTEWRQQGRNNRQGSTPSSLPSDVGALLTKEEEAIQRATRDVYRHRLELGVAREQARKDLALSTFTEAFWKIDLHNLLHFLELRMSDLAQQEIREYANVIGETVVSVWCPIAWEAFVDYRLRALKLSQLEVGLIAALARNDPETALGLAREAGWLSADGSKTKPSRERNEAEGKLRMLGLVVPWA